MKQTLTNKRVLSVEDDEASQYFMQLVFEKIGCSFDLASNGQEAVDKLRAGKYNIVFMDLRMPLLDGYQTSEIIRRDIDKNIPIIAVSAHAMAEVAEKCVAVGMNAFVAKCYDMEKFEKEITAWIAKS